MILIEDSDAGGPSSLPLGWNTYFLFNSGIVNFVENQCGEGKKHYFVDFCSLEVL